MVWWAGAYYRQSPRMTTLQMRPPPAPRTCCRFQVTAAAAVLLCLGGTAFAAPRQSPTATVHGVVRDVSDAVLANATVTLTRLDTGRSRPPVRSGRDGSFRFLALSPGRYRLAAVRDGFAPAERVFELTVDLDLPVSLTLTLARRSESVSVLPTESPLVEPSKTSLGRTITRLDLDGAPILSGIRTFATLAMLAPGIQNDLAGSGAMGAAGLIGSQTVQVDGLSIDKGASETSGTPPLEAIQEFKVVTNHFSAEFGQASGAVISVLTRSGTNNASGRLYWLQQEGAWAATSAKAKQQQTTDPGLTQKIFGGTVGRAARSKPRVSVRDGGTDGPGLGLHQHVAGRTALPAERPADDSIPRWPAAGAAAR